MAKTAAQIAKEKAAEDKNTEEMLEGTPEEKAEKQKAAEEAKAAKEAEAKSKREKAAQEKAEAEAKARQALIDSGELIATDGYDFTAKESSTKTSGQVKAIIGLLKDSKVPLIFSDLCEQVDAKYPEDLQPAMHALEHTGIVKRFEGKKTGDEASNRRQLAFLYQD